MYELDHSVPKEYDHAVDVLYRELCNDISKYRRKNKISRGDLQSIREVIQCFLKNCKMSNGSVMSITLDKNSYVSNYICNGRLTNRKVSYRFTKDLVTFLYNNGYIGLQLGSTKWMFDFIKNKYILEDSIPTLIIFKKPLIDLLDTIRSPNNHRTNVVFLKGADGYFKGFRVDDEIAKERDFLQGWNLYSLENIVMCGENKYDVQSYKVLNIKTYFGGRTYMGGSIQNLSGEERAKITINGNKTCRYDYKAFEPSLAYSINNKLMVGDPYTLTEGFEQYDKDVLRKVCKHALLVMLNADSRTDTAYCLNSFIKENYDVAVLYDKGMIPKKKIPVSLILDALEQKHSDISHMFYNSSWKVLQRTGGKIIDSVVEYMMQNHDCLCLQVFDECIVDVKFEKHLVQAMIDSYAEVTGMPENCKIDKEN